MIAIYKQRGESIDYVPVANVAASDVVVQNDLVAIANLDIKAGELGSLATTGVFDLPKAAGEGEGVAAGKKVYWNEAAKVVTVDDNGGVNKFLGKSILAAADGDETVLVRLSQ